MNRVLRGERDLFAMAVVGCILVSCGGRTSVIDENGSLGSGGMDAPGVKPDNREPNGNIAPPLEPGPSALCEGVVCSNGEGCVFGRCVSSPVDCNLEQIECDSEPPTCAPGYVPTVIDKCYGPCVEVASCGYVDDCSVCHNAGTLCLGWDDAHETFYGCANPALVPEACESCDCLPTDICGTLQCLTVSAGIAVCVDDSLPITPVPPIDPTVPPPHVSKPELGSYLDGRGAMCGECVWSSCDQDLANCLASEECSYWHGCLVFCAGRSTETIAACQLECFHGDSELMSKTLGGLECLLNTCCSECGAPCE